MKKEKVLYKMNDKKNIIKILVWKDYDIEKEFKVMKNLIELWKREIEGKIN